MLAFFRTRPDEKTPPAKAAVSLVIAAALIVGFFWLSLSRIDYRPDFSFLPEFKIRIWDGFWLTVAVSLASMVVSLLLGSLAAGGEMSRWLPLRYLSRAYVVFIRGTHHADLPLLLSGGDGLGRGKPVLGGCNHSVGLSGGVYLGNPPRKL